MNRYIIYLLAISILVLPGCASNRDMGRLIYSSEAEGPFLDDNGTAKYNYYVYNGSGERPVAYLALDKKYSFNSQFWYPTKMSGTLWREIYHSTEFFREDDYQAKVILSSQAEKIGYMLTRYYMVTAWLAEPGSSVVIVPPPRLSPGQNDYRRWRLDSE
ncbi:hypothetical protein [Desulfopila aestuarii]|uniref:Uncharacterized protein n=1 Tax=Desulfopila aestuarii DSM 18488 TaxID=1121416 RepID=A0A1M7Y8V3_9BACT|nr:hypothetical protein [Desulfopila aestuarii]SHO49065.1 hypothetical protein SAMN02745220_02667 [Desulfopila aestuarii DSM 18488]